MKKPRRTDTHPADLYEQWWASVCKLGKDHKDSCKCYDCILRKEYVATFDVYDARLAPDETGKLRAPIGLRLEVCLWAAENRAKKKFRLSKLTKEQKAVVMYVVRKTDAIEILNQFPETFEEWERSEAAEAIRDFLWDIARDALKND